MNPALFSILSETAHRNADRYRAFLQELLRIPTPRMREHRCIRFLGDSLSELGQAVTWFEGLGLMEETPDGPPLNFFCTRPGTGGGRSLLVEAHIDTVPPGDERKWDSSPWSGEIGDGRIYARGAHDDRVGAAMLWMLRDLLDQCGVRTKGDLHFLVTTEEEFCSGGMKAFLSHPRKFVPDAHIGLDGNRGNACITGHAGALPFEVVFDGAWGSVLLASPTQDLNPLTWACRFIAELERFAEVTRARFRERNSDARWPDPVLIPNAIHTRDWMSNLPEQCTVRVFANVMPPITLAEFKRWVAEFVDSFVARNPSLGAHPPRVEWLPVEIPSYVLPEDSELLRELGGCHREAFGVSLETRYIGGWGDMRLLGSPEVILCGPGGGGGGHTYNEYFELDALVPTLITLGLLTAHWCGIEESSGLDSGCRIPLG